MAALTHLARLSTLTLTLNFTLILVKTLNATLNLIFIMIMTVTWVLPLTLIVTFTMTLTVTLSVPLTLTLQMTPLVGELRDDRVTAQPTDEAVKVLRADSVTLMQRGHAPARAARQARLVLTSDALPAAEVPAGENERASAQTPALGTIADWSGHGEGYGGGGRILG